MSTMKLSTLTLVTLLAATVPIVVRCNSSSSTLGRKRSRKDVRRIRDGSQHVKNDVSPSAKQKRQLRQYDYDDHYDSRDGSDPEPKADKEKAPKSGKEGKSGKSKSKSGKMGDKSGKFEKSGKSQEGISTPTPTFAPNTFAPNTPPPTPSFCSCSPIEFVATLSLSQTCDNDDLDDNGGIGETFCVVDDYLTTPDAAALLPETESRSPRGWVYVDPDHHHRSLQITDRVPVEIIGVQFLEFDSSGQLIVINQDDSYSNVSFGDGVTFQYTSITGRLDPAGYIDEQMDLVPGGASLIILGKNAEGEILRNRLIWEYNYGDCNPEIINAGDEFGWVTLDVVEGPYSEFCPGSGS